MKNALAILVALPLVAYGSCSPVAGDRILGRDLATVDSAFSALSATLQLGYAPLPGSPRVFTAAELQRIAHANGLEYAAVHDVCFEWPMHVPDETEFADVMRRALPADAALRLTDMERTPVPAGRAVFEPSGLEPPANGVQLWRGCVQYTDTRRIAVWARVVITQSYPAVVARRDLMPGTTLDVASLQLETRTGPWKREPGIVAIENATGRVLLRPLKAGAELIASMLADAPVVRRGDPVKVEVQSGLAVLRFEAIAESNARAGEVVEVHNPINGKLIRVRLGAGASAVIVVGKTPSL